MASDADKPDGFLMITAEQARVRFGASPPLLIPGIGPKTGSQASGRGIRALDQLAAIPDPRLSEWFGGRLGPHLAALARFEDDRVLETDRVRKSESRETTFDTDLRGLAEMEPVLADLARQLCDDLSETGAAGGRWASRCAPTTSRSTPARARCRRRSARSTICGRWRSSCCARLHPHAPCGCSACGWRAWRSPEPARPGAGADQLELSV